MIFNKPEQLTHLDIWTPRYSDQYKNGGERVALLACYKITHATPWVIIDFSKAKHLKYQRFCVKRSTVTSCQVDSNGKIPCYAVPMSLLENWDTVSEVKEVIASFGW